MSKPKEWEGMESYLIQEWQHDENDPCKDNLHTIGARRRIKQTFIKKPPLTSDGLWDPTTTHYWYPQIPTPTYQEFPNVKIEGDLQFYGTGAGGVP